MDEILANLPKVKELNLHNTDPAVRALLMLWRQGSFTITVLDEALVQLAKSNARHYQTLERYLNKFGPIQDDDDAAV